MTHCISEMGHPVYIREVSLMGHPVCITVVGLEALCMLSLLLTLTSA